MTGKLAIRIIVAVGGIGFSLALACVMVFFSLRDMAISGSNLKWLIAVVSPKTLAIEVEAISIRLQRPSDLFFAKEITLNADTFCLRRREGAVRFCADALRASVTLGLWRPHFISFGPIAVNSAVAAFDLRLFPKSDSSHSGVTFDLMKFLWQEVLPKWKNAGTRIEVRQIEVHTRNDDVISAKNLVLENDRELRLSIENLREHGHHVSSRVRMELRKIDRGTNCCSVSLDVLAHWQLSPKARVDSYAHLKGSVTRTGENKASIRIQSSFDHVAGLRNASINGSLDWPLFLGTFFIKVAGGRSVFRSLEVHGCDLTANLLRFVGDLSCGAKTVRLEIAAKGSISESQRLVLAPEFKFELSQLELASGLAESRLMLKVGYLEFLKGVTELTGHYHWSPTGPAHFALDGSADIQLTAWEKLIRHFANTPYAVPAPLNVLIGKLNTDAKFSFDENGGVIRYGAKSDLHSTDQAIRLRLNGVTKLEFAHLSSQATEADLFVDQLKLVAPRFDLKLPPQVRLDSRFGPFSPQQPAPSRLAGPGSDLRFVIETESPNAIHIATNFTEGDLPVNVNLAYQKGKTRNSSQNSSFRHSGELRQTISMAPVNLSKDVPAPLTGSIEIGKTRIKILHRNATLENLKIDIPPFSAPEISGAAQVQTIDYDVKIMLSGTTRVPQIVFISNPPLDENQILAVLLFGRPLNELEDDQSNSVAGFQAAIANAALGLSSLFFLSNTPVESVAYDPNRQIVSASIGLNSRTALEVGGGSDTNLIGVRGHIGRNFTLRTNVEALGTSGKESASAMLEWTKRF